MRSRLRQIFTDPHYPGYRLWHNLVTIFIFGSCISLALESVPGVKAARGLSMSGMAYIDLVFDSAAGLDRATVGKRAAA